MGTLNSSRNDDFFISDVFSRAVRYWWVVALLTIAGGVIGCLVSILRQPIYESTAEITTVIDYAYAGRLTDYEEDHLLSAIGDIILSDEVMNKAVAKGVSTGLVPDGEKMQAGLTASRQGYRWELSSRFTDPLTAQEVNQLWLDAAIEGLEAFRLDSISALVQLNAQMELEACFAQSVILEPTSPYCNVEGLQKLQQQAGGFYTEVEGDSLLSRLLASRISFQVTQEPDLPVSPIHYGRNISTLAGALAGLLLSIILLITGYPRTKVVESSK
jgi:hypothetical protein